MNPYLDGIGVDNDARNYSAAGSRPHSLSDRLQLPRAGSARSGASATTRSFAACSTARRSPASPRFKSGPRGRFSYAFTGAPSDRHDSAAPGRLARRARPAIPNLPRGERTLERQFRTECVAGARSAHRSGQHLLSGQRPRRRIRAAPGLVNQTSTLFKNFRLPGARNVQNPAPSSYNLFNSDQFTQRVDASAQFNFATGAQTDANFGRVHRHACEKARRASSSWARG